MLLNSFSTGTVYYQQDKPFLIMSGFCVYSVASALFMFPVMQHYFGKALEVNLKKECSIFVFYAV